MIDNVPGMYWHLVSQNASHLYDQHYWYICPLRLSQAESLNTLIYRRNYSIKIYMSGNKIIIPDPS